MTIPYSLDLRIDPLGTRIGFDDKIVLMGSCFTEHIGGKLNDRYFDTLMNPNGIVFNPLSLLEPLKRVIDGNGYSEGDLVRQNELWSSIYHHGKFSNRNKEKVLNAINKEQLSFSAYLKQADWLIVTFGTAWVYTLKERDEIVANCHKLPQHFFSKHLLSVDEIAERWLKIMEQLLAINPALNVIFTVSPVKHLRDGVHENNLSKATLLLAIEKMKSKNIHYFPAYELVIDDLRDYRFFDSDGAHPNSMAIDYVFDKFSHYAFAEKTQQAMKAVSDYRKLEQHRPLDTSQENTDKLKYHAEAMRDKIIELYPILKNRL
ncbi:MAG: GSCFA domain-containing protein [Bacteroidota bacterium]